MSVDWVTFTASCLHNQSFAMPALRKSARDRDLRTPHQRSSTTPYASPTSTPSEPIHEKKQRSITEWTEPQPQSLAPSFEDHGFARHGVLENMAPLGVPPKARDKQRVRAIDGVAPRHSSLGKGSLLAGDEVGSTPEVTPAPELELELSGLDRQEEDEVHAEFALLDEEEDDDYEPTKMKKKVKASKTPVRGKTPAHNKTPVQGRTPLKNGHRKSVSISASPAVQAIQPLELDDDAQRMLIAVNDAVSRANKDSKRRVGVAIKRMFEDSKTDVVLAGAMHSVIHRDATDEQWDTFRAFIKQVKKEEKTKARMSQEDRYGQNASDDIGEPVFGQQSPRASSEVVPDDSISTVHDIQYQKFPAHSALSPVLHATKDTHRALQSVMSQESAPDPLHPFSTAPNLPVADSSAESTPRMPSKSPRKRHATNGHLASGSTMDVDGGVSTSAPTPAARTPETGGSDSELSDVNEDIVQKGPPEPAQPNGKGAAASLASGPKKGKNTAHARAAKKMKNSAGKLFGKHANKMQPPTAEQLAEDEQLHEMRKAMVDQQPIRRLEQIRPPISDVRFDDEILETESLTDSQIAVGPPVDSDQPRRAGRVPYQGTKRFREDASRFSSPQLDSVAVTRPSTPAVGPAPKRLKLTNGQAAKTKRS